MARYKLGDICEIVSGSTPRSEVAEYWDGDIKWITPAELNEDSYIVSDTVRKITPLAVQKTGLTPFPTGTVILSSRAPIGKVAIAGCEMYCNQGFKNLICSRVIDSRYLYWFLKGKTAYLNSLGRGATFKEISKQIVASIEIEVPSMEQQITIIELLEKMKEIIKARQRQLLVLDTLIKARFVEMFGDPIRNTQNRPTTDFINVVKMQRGFDLPVQDRQQDGEIPVFGSNGALDRHNVAKVFGGGVITGRSGTIGKVYYTERDYWPLNTSLFSVDMHGNNIIYLAYLLMMYDFTRFTEGTGVPTLNRNKFHNKPIIEVPVEEQVGFADYVKQVDKSKAIIQEALDKTQQLFDNLMQQYFGKNMGD